MPLVQTNPEDIAAIVVVILVYGSPFFLLVLGLVAGSMIENKHYRQIREREKATAGMPTVPIPAVDPSFQVADARMVVSSVVVSLDYFKRFLAGIRKIFGGRIRAYESLLDRGRREAILRLKEQVPDADIIVNLRLETSTIANTQRKQQGIGAIEVLAYGTAVRYVRSTSM